MKLLSKTKPVGRNAGFFIHKILEITQRILYILYASVWLNKILKFFHHTIYNKKSARFANGRTNQS
jgi:hypothetical protein